MSEIYFDNAATTPMRPEVVQAMSPFFTEVCGNPSSLHMSGQRARRAMEEARQTVAAALGADSKEIFFTSGGTRVTTWPSEGLRSPCGTGDDIS